MKEQLIVSIGYHIDIIAPSIKAGTDLLTLLSKCQRVEIRYEDSDKVYRQTPLDLTTEIVRLEQRAPVKQPRTSPVRAARATRHALPAPSLPQLPWTADTTR